MPGLTYNVRTRNASTGSTMPADKSVDHIRLDCISRSESGLELWWVAKSFSDESTQPEGMFAQFAEAETLANKLATEHGVRVVVTRFDDQ